MSFAGLFWDEGLGHAFFSQPMTMGGEGKGWHQIETILVRLDTALCPNASFGRIVNNTRLDTEAGAGKKYQLGVDVGVCVEMFESYIVESFSSPAAKPVTVALVGEGYSVANGMGLVDAKKIGDLNGDANVVRFRLMFLSDIM